MEVQKKHFSGTQAGIQTHKGRILTEITIS